MLEVPVSMALRAAAHATASPPPYCSLLAGATGAGPRPTSACFGQIGSDRGDRQSELTKRRRAFYGNDLAVGTLDAECSDVLGKIRKDFDAAGVIQSDEQ